MPRATPWKPRRRREAVPPRPARLCALYAGPAGRPADRPPCRPWHCPPSTPHRPLLCAAAAPAPCCWLRCALCLCAKMVDRFHGDPDPHPPSIRSAQKDGLSLVVLTTWRALWIEGGRPAPDFQCGIDQEVEPPSTLRPAARTMAALLGHLRVPCGAGP
jgi:hypothetical protein